MLFIAGEHPTPIVELANNACLGNFRVADYRAPISDSAVLRGILNIVEITILSLLILVTRCANYQDVFIGGNVYFVDPDCYARMTRVRLVNAAPGLIVRHHQFENFPQGTTPHTTAPLDYLILGLSKVIVAVRPVVAPYHLDLAGASISPLLALIGGWFLWWWSRRMKFRYRWVMLIVYAISPILVQGTELGRPDHQSLAMLLVTIGICAEWSVAQAQIPAGAKERGHWSVVSGIAWGMAIWNSAYESLVLFSLVIVLLLVLGGKDALHSGAATAKSRRGAWVCFASIIAIASLIERRVPSLSILHPDAVFKNWARTIGELVHVSPTNPVWLRWCGYLLVVVPFLMWMNMRRQGDRASKGCALAICFLLIVTYLLTIWQARWGYFFVLMFALALPALLEPVKSRAAVWIAFVLSLLPILRDWDERFWPNETQLAARVERLNESAQTRDLALNLQSLHTNPFIAPWWLSPAIAYWSGQPGVAGSSHESLKGIEDTARFFLSEDLQKAQEIIQKHKAVWIVSYDSERVSKNSAAVLNEAVPTHPLCRLLDRTPSQAAAFLIFSAQNATFKLYRVAANDNSE